MLRDCSGMGGRCRALGGVKKGGVVANGGGSVVTRAGQWESKTAKEYPMRGDGSKLQ